MDAWGNWPGKEPMQKLGISWRVQREINGDVCLSRNKYGQTVCGFASYKVLCTTRVIFQTHVSGIVSGGDGSILPAISTGG